MNEYLLNNYIETSFQKFLYPLNLAHFLVYSPKYCISDNFITPNNNKTKYLSLCCALLFIVIVIVVVFHNELRYNEGVLLLLFIIIYIIIASSFIINFIVNSIQSDVNVEFIVTIQTINPSFQFFKIDFESFIFGNWIYVFILSFSYIFLIGTHFYQSNFSLILCLYYIALIISDVNVIYLTRVIQLLTHVTQTWMAELKHVDEMTKDTGIFWKESVQLKSIWKTLFKAYLDITNAASLYEEMAKIQIVFYIITDLFSVLLHVEIVLVYPDDFWSNTILGFIWTLKYFILIAIISFKTEEFFTTLKNTQVFFLLSDATDECSGKHVLSKSVLRAGNAAYVGRDSGAFALDARLPLSLLSCIATHVVVILQFKLT
nr:gustatory receptor 29.1 [Papilio memnon]